jgi:hypothetical protein
MRQAFYDVDDKGHPVAVGHRLRQALPRCRYFEFSSVASGEWDAARLPAEILSLVRDEWPAIAKCVGWGSFMHLGWPSPIAWGGG